MEEIWGYGVEKITGFNARVCAGYPASVGEHDSKRYDYVHAYEAPGLQYRDCVNGACHHDCVNVCGS